MAPFTARSRSSVSSVLTILDGRAARGYAGIPQVERAVMVHLCPRNAATWKNRSPLPSKACKLTAALAAKAYSAAGQAASALHAMAILQVPTKPRHSNRCTRVVVTRGWCMSCARQLTSLYERRPSGRRCPPWWSRSAISGSTWQKWGMSTRHAFSTPPSPRQGCSATPSRALPSSSRRYSSRPRRSSTSCHGVMHHPPLTPGPGLSLPVNFRSSEQLFVCHGGQQKGKAVSKQRLAHWIVDAVALAYQSQGEPCPLGVRAHSTGSVASSHALAHGASLADICRAAGWATPNTFARFYSLCVEPVSSCVVGNSNGREELAGVTLAVPFPLTRGYERLFSPPVQFPGRWTLVESSKHPRQSD